MSVEPVVVEQRVAAPEAAVVLSVPPDLECFADHFPGSPVVPGVVQIQWAIEAAHRLLAIRGEFVRMEALKFQQAMTPGVIVTLTLHWSAADGTLGFVFEAGGSRFSSGRVVFRNGP